MEPVEFPGPLHVALVDAVRQLHKVILQCIKNRFRLLSMLVLQQKMLEVIHELCGLQTRQDRNHQAIK